MSLEQSTYKEEVMVESIDLYQIFLGEEGSWIFLIEIILRTVVLFSWILLNIRLLGKRNIGQLTPFELLITIALGSASGDPMFYPEVPLLHGMIVITTIVCLQKFLSYITSRNERIESYTQGNPVVLIKHGEIDEAELSRQKLTKEDLFSQLRVNGVENTGQVKYAFLEVSGKMSVITFVESSVFPGESTLPHHPEVS